VERRIKVLARFTQSPCQTYAIAQVGLERKMSNSKVIKANKNGKAALSRFDGESGSFPIHSPQCLPFPAHPGYKHVSRARSAAPEETRFGP
jgi:hypothetical protein